MAIIWPLLRVENLAQVLYCLAEKWTNLSKQDKTWAEFSTVDVSVLVHALQLHSQLKDPN